MHASEQAEQDEDLKETLMGSEQSPPFLETLHLSSGSAIKLVAPVLYGSLLCSQQYNILFSYKRVNLLIIHVKTKKQQENSSSRLKVLKATPAPWQFHGRSNHASFDEKYC